MNFILMQFGYPSVIIKTEDKENYYAVLRLADADELEPFIEYIAQNLVHSLEIMIKGAKAVDIEEPDDLDKEIALLEKRLRFSSSRKFSKKNDENMEYIFENSIIPLCSEFLNTCRKFDKLYSDFYFQIFVTQLRASPIVISGKQLFEDFQKYFDNIVTQVALEYTYEGLNKNDVIDFASNIIIHFGKKSYIFTKKDGTITFEKSYSEILSHKEIKSITKNISEEHKKFIEEKIVELNEN